MISRHSYIFLLIFVASLSACLVGKKYTPPPQPEGITYRDTLFKDTSQLMKWFDLYKDTALKSMIRITLDSNKDILTASSRIDEARLRTAVIKANLWPKLDYSGQAGGGSAGTDAQKIASGIQGGFLNAFAVLNWELDLWGKTRHLTESAMAKYFSEVQNRNALLVSLVAEVASDYFILRDLDNRLEIARQTLASRKVNTNIIKERFNKGWVPELDELQAIQQETIAAATIPSLQRQIVQTENAIRLLMGMGPGLVSRGYSNFDQTLSPEIPVGLPSQLLERRPDIMAAEESMRSQYEQIGFAQANRFPTISLTGILGFASPELSTFLTSSGFVANGFGSITGPIFHFNQLKNSVEVQKRQFDQANLQYQKTVLAAFGDVDNALTFYKTFAEEYEQLKIQTDAATKGLKLSEARYEYGYTSYLEVIFMQDNLFNAQLQESEALQGKLNSIVLLYKALGGGW